MLLTLVLHCANMGARTEVVHMLNTERIKARLDELNMTQADLATVISVAVPTMCQKINNIRPLSLDEAEKIARALQIEDKDFGSYFFSQ